MARLRRDGAWTSKCGGAEDIKHFTLDALESYGGRVLTPQGALRKAEYGCPEMYMKRFIPLGWVVRALQWITWKLETAFPYVGFWIWKRRQ